MPRVGNMRCCLCGKKHQDTVIAGLMAHGWYVEGISEKDTGAKRLICPECLQRIYGKKLDLSLAGLWDTQKGGGFIQNQLFGDIVNEAESSEEAVSGPKDRPLLCCDCKREFIWTVEEQELYSKHGYDTPRRCPTCRVVRYIKKRRH